MFGERALHTRSKMLQNKTEERAEESDKVAVRRERFVGSTVCTYCKIPIGDCRRTPPPSGPQLPSPTAWVHINFQFLSLSCLHQAI